MPLIDLKNTTVVFEDGYSEAGAVNLMAGYTAGASSIVVDGIVGIIPEGSRINFVGDVTDYTVVSTVESSGNTTTIVISPVLVEDLTDNQVFNVYGVFLEIKVGEGTITWSENSPREFKLDRGLLDQVRDADQVPMDVSFQLMYEALTASNPSTDPPTPMDVIYRRGAAASWVSTNPDTCAPFCFNIRMDHSPPNCGSAFPTERTVLPMFYTEKKDYDPKQGMISISGKCNAVKANVTRLV